MAVVLIYRALGLGDFLTGVPAYRALRRAFPSHRVVLAAPRTLAPLAELTGAIDEVADTAPLGPAPVVGADVAVNLHGRGPQSHALLRAARPGRLIAWGEGWRADEHEVARWCRLLRAHGIPADPDDLDLDAPAVESLVPGATVIHPGAASEARRWPAERWAEVARHELAVGRLVAITGSAGERALAERVARAAAAAPLSATPYSAAPPSVAALHAMPAFAAPRDATPPSAAPLHAMPAFAAPRDAVPPSAAPLHAAPPSAEPGGHSGRLVVLAGETDLLGLAATVAHAGRVFCGDTGVAHLATAFGTPSVVLFGPTPPAEWGPPANRSRHQVLWAGRRGDPHGDTPDPGLLALSVEQVLEATSELPAGTRTA